MVRVACPVRALFDGTCSVSSKSTVGGTCSVSSKSTVGGTCCVSSKSTVGRTSLKNKSSCTLKCLRVGVLFTYMKLSLGTINIYLLIIIDLKTFLYCILSFLQYCSSFVLLQDKKQEQISYCITQTFLKLHILGLLSYNTYMLKQSSSLTS